MPNLSSEAIKLAVPKHHCIFMSYERVMFLLKIRLSMVAMIVPATPRKSFSLLKACFSLRPSPAFLVRDNEEGRLRKLHRAIYFLQTVNISTHVSESVPNRAMVFQVCSLSGMLTSLGIVK